MRHPRLRWLAAASLVVAAGACGVIAAYCLLGGSTAVSIGIVYEVLPRLSPSGGSSLAREGATVVGLGIVGLALVHLGLAVAQLVAALFLCRGRARTYVLLCCGLSVLLGVGSGKLFGPNLWSNLTVVGALVAGSLAWMVLPQIRGPHRSASTASRPTGP
jgi:hypothetical protein